MRLALINGKLSMNHHLLKCSFILFAVSPTCIASEPLVIVAFGDSTTAQRESVKVFAKRLEEQFAKESHSARVINAGIPGNTSRQARERLDHDVIAYHPHVVTISFGINDSAIDVFKEETKPRVPLDEYQRNLIWMVKRLQCRNIIPVLMTPNPVAWTDELKRVYGKPPYRPDQPDGWNVLLKDYSQAVRRVAKDQQVPLVDTYRLFTEYSAAPGHNLNDLMLDGMHPADLGHAIIADHLMARLKELEREKR